MQQIIDLLGKSASEVSMALTMLELKGLIEKLPGNMFGIKADRFVADQKGEKWQKTKKAVAEKYNLVIVESPAKQKQLRNFWERAIKLLQVMDT